MTAIPQHGSFATDAPPVAASAVSHALAACVDYGTGPGAPAACRVITVTTHEPNQRARGRRRVADIGAQAGGRLSGLPAFAAVDSYLTGAADVLDQVALSR